MCLSASLAEKYKFQCYSQIVECCPSSMNVKCLQLQRVGVPSEHICGICQELVNRLNISRCVSKLIKDINLKNIMVYPQWLCIERIFIMIYYLSKHFDIHVLGA